MDTIGRRCSFSDRFSDGAVLRSRGDVECEVGLSCICYLVADEVECIRRFLVEAEKDKCGRLGARVKILDQLCFLEVEGGTNERGDAGVVDPGEIARGGGKGREFAEEEDAGAGESGAEERVRGTEEGYTVEGGAWQGSA